MPFNNNDDEIFEQIVRDAIPSRMISNFILVAEIIDDESEQLSLYTSDRMTPWLAKGMLKSAQEMISDAEYLGDDSD